MDFLLGLQGAGISQLAAASVLHVAAAISHSQAIPEHQMRVRAKRHPSREVRLEPSNGPIFDVVIESPRSLQNPSIGEPPCRFDRNGPFDSP
jgi:hypothetical protein